MNTRERLPNRRRSDTVSFSHGGLTFTASFGRYADGRLGEVFVDSSKRGSHVEALAKDGAVLISLALQHGAALETIRHALLRDANGHASSPLGHALDIAEDAP
jgi:hypothetical protein